MRNNLFSSYQNKNIVDVLFFFNGAENYARPVRLFWEGDEYELGGVQFWYAEYRGATRVHHYRIGDVEGRFTFELSLETENLTWSLDRTTDLAKKPKLLPAASRLIGAVS